MMRVQTVECSGRIVLACHCGERIVLLGSIDDWYTGEPLNFICGCGNTLTLADCLSEDWTVPKS